MELLKNTISYKQNRLKYLIEQHNRLIMDIKKKIYNHNRKYDWSKQDEIKIIQKRKPEGNKQCMVAALCYTYQNVVYNEYSIDLSKVFSLRNNNWQDKIYHDYYYYNLSQIRSNAEDKQYFIFEKKNIKQIKEICHTIWLHLVTKEKTITGYKEWLDQISIDDIYENYIFGDRFFLGELFRYSFIDVDVPQLGIKDIIICVPKEKNRY